MLRELRRNRISQSELLRAVAWCLLLAVGFAPMPVSAQLSTTSVTGVVRDSSGSIVAGAKLILTNTETGVRHEAASNNAGNYVFVSIPPGTYSLEATASGFQTSQVPRISLAVNQTSTLDVNLQLGEVKQTVTVEASAELLQASTSELGAVVGEKQVVDLPLNGRNFTQLLSLSPGVS